MHKDRAVYTVLLRALVDVSALPNALKIYLDRDILVMIIHNEHHLAYSISVKPDSTYWTFQNLFALDFVHF